MRHKLRTLLALALALITAWPHLVPPALAQSRGLQIIRDAEIEHIIRIYVTPIFQVAGLDPEAVDVYLVSDDSLNAFVAGGQNLFINTGLLIAAEDPLEVIGVLAHETGHMAGGHYAQRTSALDSASTQLIAAYVLGIIGAIATGRGDVGVGIAGGIQDAILRSLLSFTRSQEQSADQAAMTYLRATGLSPRGLEVFMGRLRGQEVLLSSNQDPYLSTHPLTSDRMDFIEEEVHNSPYADAPAPPDLVALHQRLRAKLAGFMRSSNQVLQLYPLSDQSLPARYARAIMYYQQSDLKSALGEIDSLLAENLQDPYFIELKAQMLFENGRLKEALPLYRQAVDLLPREAQIRLMLARTLIELPSEANDREALEHLDLVLIEEPSNGLAWRQAAVAHGRLGDEAMAVLCLAEYALAQGNYGDAIDKAGRAKSALDPNSAAWLQADDVEREAQRRAQASN